MDRERNDRKSVLMILSAMLMTNHNLHFLVKTMENIRQAIDEDRFLEYKKEFFDAYGKF